MSDTSFRVSTHTSTSVLYVAHLASENHQCELCKLRRFGRSLEPRTLWPGERGVEAAAVGVLDVSPGYVGSSFVEASDGRLKAKCRLRWL